MMLDKINLIKINISKKKTKIQQSPCEDAF